MTRDLAREKRVRDSMRFINTFGQREPEIAAIIIYDRYARLEPQPVDPQLFEADDSARWGFRDLKAGGYISEDNVPTARFWQKCHEAEAQDRDGYPGGGSRKGWQKA